MDGIITGIILTIYGILVILFDMTVTQYSFLFVGIGWLIASIALVLFRLTFN